MKKRNISIKGVLTGIALTLAILMLVILFMQVFGTGRVKPSEWFGKTEQEQPTVEEETANSFIALPSANKISGLSLEVTPYASTELADGSLMVPKADTYSLKPIIQPAENESASFKYTGEWVNSSSVWAKGRNVTDYVTITPNGRNATVQVKQAFGESIRVWCTYEFNSTIKDYVQFEFIKPVTDINIDAHAVEGFTEWDINLRLGNEVVVTYGTGTVQGQFDMTSVYAEFSEEAYNVLRASDYYNSFLDMNNGDWDINRTSSSFTKFDDGGRFWDEAWYINELSFLQDYSDYRNDYTSAQFANMWSLLRAAIKYSAIRTTNNICVGVTYKYSYNGMQINNDTAFSTYYSLDPDYIYSSYFTG